MVLLWWAILSVRLPSSMLASSRPWARAITMEDSLQDELERQLREALNNVPDEERRASDQRIIDNFVDQKKTQLNPVQDDLNRRLDDIQDSLEEKVEAQLTELREETAAKIDAAVASLLSSKQKSDSSPVPGENCGQVALNSVIPKVARIVVAGSVTSLGQRLLTTLSKKQPGWKLVALVSEPDKAPPFPDEVECRAYSPFTPSSLARVVADADALVVLCDRPCGAGGVEPKVMGRLMNAIGKKLRRLLIVSAHGVERTSQLPYSLQNALGGALDRQRAAEQEAVLRAQETKGGLPAYSIARFGKISDVDDLAATDSTRVELAPGDALSADIPSNVASDLLMEALLRDDAVNATFSAAVGDSISWEDEFIKLVGPELLRIRLEKVQPNQVVEWLRDWAQLFLRPGSGLTTPVQIVEVNGGVLLRFIDQGVGYRDFDEDDSSDAKWKDAVALRSAKEGGRPGKSDGALRIVAESTPFARVRVCRAEMDNGATVKPMSEAAILQRLERDLKSLES